MAFVAVDELLENSHVIEDPDGRGADGIPAVLVTREGLLVKEGDPATILGKVVSTDGTRGASANNRSIIGSCWESADWVLAGGGHVVCSSAPCVCGGLVAMEV